MLILSHRGHPAANAGENTIEAFQEAVRRGAQGVEFDVRVAKDGELVVVHDATLRRVALTNRKIRHCSSKDLAEIELRRGGCVPLLRQVTAAIHAPALLNVEIKDPDAVEALCHKLSTSAALRERCIVSSFHASALQVFRTSYPEMRTILLLRRWPFPLRFAALERRIRQVSPWAVGIPFLVATEARLEELRGLGVRVAVWDQKGSRLESREIANLRPDIAIVRRTEDLS
jgi:glycerophosphoryl diester phosphodiesterase